MWTLISRRWRHRIGDGVSRRRRHHICHRLAASETHGLGHGRVGMKHRVVDGGSGIGRRMIRTHNSVGARHRSRVSVGAGHGTHSSVGARHGTHIQSHVGCGHRSHGHRRKRRTHGNQGTIMSIHLLHGTVRSGHVSGHSLHVGCLRSIHSVHALIVSARRRIRIPIGHHRHRTRYGNGARHAMVTPWIRTLMHRRVLGRRSHHMTRVVVLLLL